MRALKFRAWDGEQMVSPDYITRDGVAHWKANSIPESSKIVLQYPGLPDKNGEEICAGDRLKYEVKGFPIRTAVVEASPGRFTFYWEDEQVGESHTQPLYPYSEKCWEIIGNIHEIQS